MYSTFAPNEIPTEDGTYVNAGGKLARVESDLGFEVAWASIPEGEPVTLSNAECIGVWHSEDGTVYLYRTVRVFGTLEAALSIAEKFDQLAIWSWEEHKVIELIAA